MLELLQGSRLCVRLTARCSRLSRPEMLDDPQFAAREAITEVETERFGLMKMQGAFPKLSTGPGGVRSPATSQVGQHNAEIYDALLGLTKAEVEGLAANGVV
jgi:crotonobetainyl-CoA:carnitine CoA-transferase CaiB-like acyl-CoA transferase